MSGCFQLMFGKLYSLLPAKLLALPSLAAFAADALFSALAPMPPVLIVGRAPTGFATAGIISGAFFFRIAFFWTCCGTKIANYELEWSFITHLCRKDQPTPILVLQLRLWPPSQLLHSVAF